MFHHPGGGGINALRVEREGYFVSVKRQVGDAGEYENHMTLDPESALALVSELCRALVEIRRIERADRHRPAE